MSTEQNKVIVRRFTEEGWNQGNLAVFDELLAPNYVAHDPTMTVHGPEGFKQFYAGYHTAFPDTHLESEDLIAEGDKVVDRWTATGTHLGPLMGIPPTGKSVRTPGMSIHHIVNDKFEESWFNYDLLGLLQQLGAIPPMG